MSCKECGAPVNDHFKYDPRESQSRMDQEIAMRRLGFSDRMTLREEVRKLLKAIIKRNRRIAKLSRRNIEVEEALGRALDAMDVARSILKTRFKNDNPGMTEEVYDRWCNWGMLSTSHIREKFRTAFTGVK